MFLCPQPRQTSELQDVLYGSALLDLRPISFLALPVFSSIWPGPNLTELYSSGCHLFLQGGLPINWRAINWRAINFGGPFIGWAIYWLGENWPRVFAPKLFPTRGAF